MALLSRRSFQRYRNGLIHGLFSAKFHRCSRASQRSLFRIPADGFVDFGCRIVMSGFSVAAQN